MLKRLLRYALWRPTYVAAPRVKQVSDWQRRRVTASSALRPPMHIQRSGHGAPQSDALFRRANRVFLIIARSVVTSITIIIDVITLLTVRQTLSYISEEIDVLPSSSLSVPSQKFHDDLML